MNMRNCWLAAGLFGATMLWDLRSEASDPIAVVVNAANPIASAALADLRPIFQTTKTSWDNTAEDAVPINLPEDSAVRREFDQAVLGLDPDRVARYWQDRKIRGGPRAPTRVPSSALVLKVVASKPAAIGYVKLSEVNSTVKVVATIAGGRLSTP